ncbi:unknown [[Mannheimia] succiniciproducens MBEL55E]|uniref:Uncharacterized protein n=1 Tax=Mannheimia succiniciproducens (strain KCTC 0769BP / MBEL55E) TaxID=221988 RepID=Q65QP4_MANSM|nr:unknown [[Mannheimia] succiniciproducens MBEL55E]
MQTLITPEKYIFRRYFLQNSSKIRPLARNFLRDKMNVV